MLNLTKLHSLDLTNNPTVSNTDIVNLNELRELRLERNQLVSCLPNFQHLAILDLSQNSLITNENLLQLPSITHLSLCNNKIITGETFVQLTNIRKLNLSNNESILNSHLQKMSNLRHLSLGHNSMITDQGISHFDLESLNLHGNKLITNNAVSKFSSLTQLILSHNKIIVPNTLIQLTSMFPFYHYLT